MKSILVPVDFSRASAGAVDYAVHWAKHYGYDQIILFKVHYESFMDYISTLGIGYSFMGKDASTQYRRASNKLLKNLQKQAASSLTDKDNIQIRTATSNLPLTRGIMEILSQHADIQLVALGSDHTKSSEPGFITTNIIKIARISPVKVLIVPEGYTYTPIKKILVPCDLQHMKHLGKLEKYSTMVSENTAVTVLNIYKDPAQQNDAVIQEWKDKLHSYFAENALQLYHTYDHDTLHGVLDFVAQHPSDLIVALPGTHSFLYYLANKSLSEGIYKNTSQALLLLK
jgi:hypothetical protein